MEKRFEKEETIETILNDVIAPSLLPEVPKELLPFVSTVQATEIGELSRVGQKLTTAQTIMEDAAAYAEEEEMMYAEEEEFVHEAEWGPGKEAAADDEEDNTME